MSIKTLVLLGVGHTNAHILRMWAKCPIPDYRLVCISRFSFVTYSGMLPGTLAGQYQPEEMQIQLLPLVKAAGAELILNEVVGLNLERQELHFQQGTTLTFDMLSIGIGSMPIGAKNFNTSALIPIKPMQTFLDRLDQRLNQVIHEQELRGQPKMLELAVVGSGVAGVEIAFCLDTHLHKYPGKPKFHIHLITQSAEILQDMQPKSRNLLMRILAERGIQVKVQTRVTDLTADYLLGTDDLKQQVDAVLWATGATAPPVLKSLNLTQDKQGFIATTSTLQSFSSPAIFAVGDSGTIMADPAPKAGVYAVRQAPILWHNLQAFAAGRSLKEYHPQSGFLKILNTGDGRALLEYGMFTIHAGWCWTLKHWIDKSFLAHYQK